MCSVRSIFATILLALAFAASASAPAQSTVTLGESIAPLVGPWKFHTGDNPQWANPSFDDSTWGTISLIPRLQNIAAYRGASYKAAIYFAPGWTMQGYPGYSGYAWYRLRVTVNREHEDVRNAGKPLAICIPPEFDDAYQIYIDGRLVGEFGRFTPRGVTWYLGRPQAFTLDRDIPSGTTLTVAIRVWMSPATLSSQRYPGGLHEPPTFGHARHVELVPLLYWRDVVHGEASAYLEIAFQLLAIVVVIGLLWLDHGELAYLWLGLSSMVSLLYIALALIQTHTLWLSGDSHAWFLFSILPPVQGGLWLLFWGYWFRLGRTGYMAWLYGFAGAALTLLAVAMVVQQSSPYGGTAPLHGAAWLMPISHGLALVPGVLLVVIAFLGIRKNGFEGWLALPAVSLLALLLVGGIWNRSLSIFGFDLPFARLVTFTALAIITLLMLRRFLHGQRQREMWKLEMEQARQVQQLLVPATPSSTSGFSVESVYLPAQQVGGDFFQVQPGEDGSLLVVVGDVSGKGLKAAMTVSAIVGGLKQIATREPSQVLAALNRQLVDELSGGFVTCCAALLTREGKLMIANAGHLSPYLNGKELAVEAGLPLGLVAGSRYEETEHEFADGDRLTFISDGVVEAQNAHKELFGFERTQQISTQPAASIADTVKQFGQEDDITVVAITRR
ncbi:MAG TPA: PP2C family protein-serine/threonine phosphatase [Acidobacteriaceae bacterium]